MENSTSASTCSSTDGLSSEPSSTDVFQKIFTFCCSDNLLERMEYLNQEIAVFGYPSIISAGMPDSVAMVNILHDLVIAYRQALADASIACEELKSAQGGNTRLEHLLFQAKDDIASLERAMKSKCSEVSYLNEKFESFRKKLRNEQEKCRRLALDLV
uniref:Uncharacterized protein n=1 Tax=Ciona savignyi TaxID=51511 RepID=H2ZLQ7_CIOSA